jgi:hypothetical protein
MARRGWEDRVTKAVAALGPLLPFAIAERGVETTVLEPSDQ